MIRITMKVIVCGMTLMEIKQDFIALIIKNCIIITPTSCQLFATN